MDRPYSFHTLILHYPAVELLPYGEVPCLTVPDDSFYREEPKLDTYHLTKDNLDFFVRYLVADGFSGSSSQEPDDDDLTGHISRLKIAAGQSNLFAVYYYDGCNLIYLFRLQTMWFAEGVQLEQHDFKMPASLWNMIQSIPNVSWITTLQELMNGSSDRAVLHRRRNLGAHYALGSPEDDFPVNWDYLPLPTAQQLVANHLCYTYRDRDHGERYAPW